MKKILLLFTLIIVTSCSDNLNCNSDEVKNQIKDIFIENTNLNSYMFSESDIDFEKLKGFYKNNVNIIQVRTSSIEKEIKKCTCEGTITFDLPQEILDRLLSNESNQFEIEYSIQKTEDGEIYTETSFPKGMNNSIAVYLKLINEERKKEDEKLLENYDDVEKKHVNTSNFNNVAFITKNSNNTFCFEEITEKDKNGVSKYLAKITIDNGKVNGFLGYFPHYDVDSWNGKLTGELINDEIIGVYEYEAEGNSNKNTYKMFISNNKLIIKFDNGEINEMNFTKECKYPN